MLAHVSPIEIKKVLFLYNRHSGKHLFANMPGRIQTIKAELQEHLPLASVELVEIKIFAEIAGLAERVLEEQIDWVIVAGGDGTIRVCVEELVKHNCNPYLSIFPAGTVNLIAKELNLSTNPLKWVRHVLEGTVRPVYLGAANGHIFLTVAGIGFDSLVVDSVSFTEKKYLSKLAYVWQGTELVRKEILFNDWRYQFQIRLDEEGPWYDASSLLIGKSRYYAGRYQLFRDAALDDPFLHVAIFTGSGKADFFKYATMIAMESLTSDKSVLVKKAKKLEVTCSLPHFPVELDGDVAAETPVCIELLEKPLNFLT